MRDVAILGLLCLLTFFVDLGRPAISDSDEAFYAEAAREMVESGDWLTPHYNYEFRFQKPILYYWLGAAAYLAAGVSEAAARFPAALSGLALALLTYAAARRWYAPDVGLAAGAIVATSFGYFFMARQSLPDLPLACFVTIGIWAVLVALDCEERGARLRWIVAGAAATAAALLTKGPVGVALPAMVLLPIVVRERRWRAPRPWLGFEPAEVALAAAVLLVLAAPWYAAMTARHGVAYLQNFFIGENVERFATDRFNEPRPFWFYVPIVLGGMLPWTPVLLLGLAPAVRVLQRRRRLTPLEWRLIIWAAAPLLFFSISIGKQPRYILPVLPPLAIAAAALVRHRAAAARRTVTALGAVTLVALAFSIDRAVPLLEAMGARGMTPAALLIGAAGALAVGVSVFRPRWGMASLAAATAVSLTALQHTVLSMAGPEPVERMAAMVNASIRPGDRPATHRVFVRNLIFYTHAPQADLPTLESVADSLQSGEASPLVIAADDVRLVEGVWKGRARQLGEVAYFNVANVKMRTILAPDPARDLETVVLLRPR